VTPLAKARAFSNGAFVVILNFDDRPEKRLDRIHARTRQADLRLFQ
jgi:hypothetical protein